MRRVTIFGVAVAHLLMAAPVAVATIGDLGEPDHGAEGFGQVLSPPKRALAGPGESIAFSHGEPTAYEQLLLELINRARADPAAEAARFGIGLNEGLSRGGISAAAKQPLAFNQYLIAAARGHSQWMLNVDQFSHVGVNGSDAGDRMTAAGYPLSGDWAWGENIAWRGTTGVPDVVAYIRTMHEGLFKSTTGHRQNLLNDRFTEVGIATVEGRYFTNGSNYNAVMVTQKLADSGGTAGPLLTGVVFRDANRNGLYDVGEGVGGVSVRIAGGAYHTATSVSGGYAVPYLLGGELRVTFESSEFGGSVTRTVGATGSNLKLDLLAPARNWGAINRVIDHYYLSVLARTPDNGGREFWYGEATRLQALGGDVGEVFMAMANYFFVSPEYVNRALDDGAYIDSLYSTFFDRPADSAGRAYWMSQLGTGLTREMVLNSFMFSPEFAAYILREVGTTPSRPEVYAVIDFYRGAFGRLPDSAGLRTWVNKFRAAQCAPAGARNGEVYLAAIGIAASFFESSEYWQAMPIATGAANRQYVSDLYNAFMRRGGDLGGFAHWVNGLLEGRMTYAQVRRSFVDSAEFAGRVRAIAEATCVSPL